MWQVVRVDDNANRFVVLVRPTAQECTDWVAEMEKGNTHHNYYVVEWVNDG
jgi:hypothetical protein